MRNRFLILVSGAILVVTMSTIPAVAEDKIQAFVNTSGRVVFTNIVENPPESEPIAAVSGGTSPSSLTALIDAIATNHGVDPVLVRAVIKTESNFNRWAVSNKGALGLMQLIPSTGRRYGVRDFFDPQQNIDGGVRYLKFLLAKFNGNVDLSLAAYNAGENLVERVGRIPSIPETANYVRRVRSIYKEKSSPAVEKSSPAVEKSSPAVASAASNPAEAAPEPPRIFKTVDARGFVHFSNIEPSN